MAISFYTEDSGFRYAERRRTKRWLKALADKYQREIDQVNYIFCSDEFLLGINRDYLQHDYYTDIITFPYQDNPISTDIYISVDRVKENALSYNSEFLVELHRVMAHGLLHMCGLKDKTELESESMRKAEDAAIKLWDATIE